MDGGAAPPLTCASCDDRYGQLQLLLFPRSDISMQHFLSVDEDALSSTDITKMGAIPVSITRVGRIAWKKPCTRGVSRFLPVRAPLEPSPFVTGRLMSSSILPDHALLQSIRCSVQLRVALLQARGILPPSPKPLAFFSSRIQRTMSLKLIVSIDSNLSIL